MKSYRDNLGRFIKNHPDLVPIGSRKQQAEKMQGRKASNKAKYNMSLAQRGKPRKKGIPHYGHRGKLIGELNPSKRADIRLKISLSKKGKKSPWTTKRNKLMSGEKSYVWKGGVSKFPYPFEFDLNLKEKIRQRDNFACQLCGITQMEYMKKYNKKLSINHIDFNKNNCKEDNLNTLCNSCNSKVNWNRTFWTSYFNNPFREYWEEKEAIK